MKTLLMAASALSLLAAPAFAQSTSTVNLTGNVAALCGTGGHSSGGVSAPTASQDIIISGLTDADGRVVAQDIDVGFGNLWCNSAASLTLKVNPLMNTVTTTDTGSFFSRIDMEVSGALLDTYFVAAQAGSPTSVGDGEYTATIPQAFETGTGAYDNATISIIAPSQDRPVAGDYNGSVVVTISNS